MIGNVLQQLILSHKCFSLCCCLCVADNSGSPKGQRGSKHTLSKVFQLKLGVNVTDHFRFSHGGCLFFSKCIKSYCSNVHPLVECSAVWFSIAVLVVSWFSPSHHSTATPPPPQDFNSSQWFSFSTQQAVNTIELLECKIIRFFRVLHKQQLVLLVFFMRCNGGGGEPQLKR